MTDPTDHAPPSSPAPGDPLAHGNLWHNLAAPGVAEDIAILLRRPGVCIERIVSQTHASPPGFWYDQDEDEFVLLVSGAATLSIRNAAEETRTVHLGPGDWLHLPAHCAHRVEATAPDQPTLWLAVFFPADQPEST
ncbi:MAG: cupin domain-containing protein [Pseudomonadota bacterium]